MSLQSAELRQRFLEFFKAKGHTIVSSDSLIPSGDPTVLFTSAGMNQFKDCFLGKRTDLQRAASCQKCLRTGDLERVGKTPSHHSFFEMLGNFSFGDYFTAEAIQWAWEFLTGTTTYDGKRPSPHQALCLNLPATKLWVSIYEEDEEACKIWKRLGVPADRIRRFGQADNFWPANAPKEGPNGPCGPCSEIYYDPDGHVQGPRSVEVWNLVFTQFDRQPDGSLKPLPRKNIDTGMGLERLTRVIQQVDTDYDTDLFTPLMTVLRRARRETMPEVLQAQQTVADHIRAIVFLISDGVTPSNTERGYVLRMLIRRTAVRMQQAGDVGMLSPDIRSLFIALVRALEEHLHVSPYASQLHTRHAMIEHVITRELQQFQETVQVGMERLTSLLAILRQAKHAVVPGEESFKLYDTYGLPLEVTEDVAQERGLTVDRQGFQHCLEAQRQRSRAESQFTGNVFVSEGLAIRGRLKNLPEKEAHFLGYETLETEGVLQGLWDGSAWVTQVNAGQSVGVVLDRSPFYGEAGGQVSDTGVLEGVHGLADVTQVTWVDNVLFHHVTLREGMLKVQEPIRAKVDRERRLQIARSHTATHLLHWALRSTLGPETVQAGSSVDAERLRFDFSSPHAVHEEQLERVEALVNSRVRLADEVRTAQMSIEAARHAGALALFGEKYGQQVRVVSVGDYSKELCGGTHLSHTGFVGTFLVVGESSVAAGTRRIEALVGEAAAMHQQQEHRLLHEAATRLGRPHQDVIAGLEDLLQQIKHLTQERKTLQLALARVEATRLVAEGKQVNGITLVTSTIQRANREVLAALADAVRHALARHGIVLLASAEDGEKVSLVMATTSDIAPRIHAGQLLKAVAPLIQGSGGGRPEFAQAGGNDPAGIPATFQRIEELIRAALERPL